MHDHPFKWEPKLAYLVKITTVKAVIIDRLMFWSSSQTLLFLCKSNGNHGNAAESCFVFELPHKIVFNSNETSYWAVWKLCLRTLVIGRAARESVCVCVCVWAGRMMREKERVRECCSGKMRERGREKYPEREREKKCTDQIFQFLILWATFLSEVGYGGQYLIWIRACLVIFSTFLSHCGNKALYNVKKFKRLTFLR